MAPKKTLSNWLTNRYLLIIRNEENFAEKKTLSFNYARLILLLFGIFIVALLVSGYLVTVALEEWLDPRYSHIKTYRQLMSLSVKLDSLEYEMTLKDQYIGNIQRIMTGDAEVLRGTDSIASEQNVSSTVRISEEIHPVDSQLRAEFENVEVRLQAYQTSATDEFRELYLFNPIEGLINDGFNPKINHYGVDIVAKKSEPVKCVADGVVILSSWTLDGGYVLGIQHRGNLVSVYKHNSELLKNVGTFVSGGDIVAIIGNTGELTSGPHLHFELWHNGNPVNPEEYIAF